MDAAGLPGAAPVTERTMVDALHARYSVTAGNGRRYVVAEQVRSHASWDARRTADYVAVDTWKSGRFEYHGHEIKISRSDWLRELAEPAKAAEFTPYMHRWWIVVPGQSIVKPGELPQDWGLLALVSGKLRAIKTAPRTLAQVMPPTRFIALLRAIQTTADGEGARRARSEGQADAL